MCICLLVGATRKLEPDCVLMIVKHRLNSPLNYILQGRRGVILLTCFMSFSSCLGQAFVKSWPELVAARLILGFGIGPKRYVSADMVYGHLKRTCRTDLPCLSATIPIYASECAPAKLRGGLVMLWQLWTAFGIMLGYIVGVAFWGINTQCDPGDWHLPCVSSMITESHWD
jgi:MFS family permease